MLSEGTNNLIRNGAILVTKGEDIIEDMLGNIEIKADLKEKGNISLSDKEQKIYDSLSLMPIFIDDLIRKTGETVTVVISALYSMEAKGFIIQETKGYYARKM